MKLCPSQDRKTEIYKDFVSDGTATLRPGIQRLIDEVVAIPVSWFRHAMSLLTLKYNVPLEHDFMAARNDGTDCVLGRSTETCRRNLVLSWPL